MARTGTEEVGRRLFVPLASASVYLCPLHYWMQHISLLNRDYFSDKRACLLFFFFFNQKMFICIVETFFKICIPLYQVMLSNLTLLCGTMKSRTTSFRKESEKSWHDVRANSSSFSAHITFKAPLTRLSTTNNVNIPSQKKRYYLISNVIKILSFHLLN